MEGPTPVSALIHAATMVTAGVYMVARMNAVFQLAPTALAVVAVVGARHCDFRGDHGPGAERHQARAGLFHRQPAGLHVPGAAAWARFTAGIFHLMTHAFFKALLFLGSGSVIHAHVRRAGHAQDGRAVEQDSDHCENFLVATIAIAGIPPLAGFFSKDAILGHAFI